MCRLIQDYFNRPVFNIPWTKDALLVYLHSPLLDSQLKEAERAEATEFNESRKRVKKMEEMLARKKMEEDSYQEYEMGTELVAPDTFTKQVYMREFIWYTCYYDTDALSMYLGEEVKPYRSRGSTYSQASAFKLSEESLEDQMYSPMRPDNTNGMECPCQ